MPKVPNYQNGLIYKIVCNDYTITNTYVGSSYDFIKRKCNHKLKCNNSNCKSYNIYVYQFIRSHGGWDNWAMLKICDFPCNNNIELITEERRHLVLLRADLNKVVPTQTGKEYYEINKDVMLEKKKSVINQLIKNKTKRGRPMFSKNKQKHTLTQVLEIEI